MFVPKAVVVPVTDAELKAALEHPPSARDLASDDVASAIVASLPSPSTLGTAAHVVRAHGGPLFLLCLCLCL